MSPKCTLPPNNNKQPKHKPIKTGPKRSVSWRIYSVGLPNFKIINILSFINLGSMPISSSKGGSPSSLIDVSFSGESSD